MRNRRRSVAAVVLAGVWINASEFLRNQILLSSLWAEHYQSLGMVFPSSPLNAAVWVVWGFVFAATICALSRKFTLVRTTGLAWAMAFLMMWLVTWNLKVLPVSILAFAMPLSLLECLGGAYLCLKVSPVEQTDRGRDG